MSYGRVVISSGHSAICRGASGIIDEVDEARRVVDHLADELANYDIEVEVFHDNTSTTQSENLETIVAFHNAQSRDLDISVHFNAYVETEKGMGCEVLYLSQSELAAELSAAIASCGFINRGAKKRTDLAFLNGCDRPAVLIEICFCDSATDCDVYEDQFERICIAIAETLAGAEEEKGPRPEIVAGRVSKFGGPFDSGVDPAEGLAFITEVEQAPHLFLAVQPPNTTGLARRLNPFVHYIAMRWDYEKTPKEMLLEQVALVRATKTGIALRAFPSDWGPHIDTDRVADISPGLMQDLGITTDDECEVIFPFNPEGDV
jgi:N-acetylmuramoyl-L-alanine amidase